jgi:formylglycine-generating enzyme required for sulfatase activity
MKLTELAPGEYFVGVSNAGYITESWTGRLEPGQTKRLTTNLKPSEEREAGSTRRDQSTGITWVWMPRGSYERGCVATDQACDNDEKPARQLEVAGFWMAKTETTVEQFEKCAEAGACDRALKAQDTDQRTCNWKNGRSAHPMNCLNWSEARAFCRWAGGRLPSATEWEYAAKSGKATIYPWGVGGPNGARANYCDKNCPEALAEADRAKWEEKGWVSKQVDDRYAGTAPVGSFQAGVTTWGLLDMAGNVWEWTDSDYNEKAKEVRGGSWFDSPYILRASYRINRVPTGRNDGLGFRCAQ